MSGIRTSLLRSVLCTSVAAGAMVAPPMASTANAQAIPVVDVCTGISLDQSALTSLLTAVNQPIVSEVQTGLNGVIGFLGGLLGVPQLNLNVTQIVDNAAAGNPISIDLLDENGSVISGGDCAVSADEFSLTDEGGLAIGGNRITGLGADGLTASAGDLNAIALGNNAQTTAAATASIALGTNAYAEVANSVAIGTDSQAVRGGQTYSAPGLAGSVTSVGELSVGSAGNERQITNVAAASAATDATNLGQVEGLIAEASLGADLAVAYDSATRDVVTLEGASGTTVTNLADGALNGTSTDAVNGSQLFATNTAVSTNATDISNLQTSVSTNTTNITNNTSDIADLQANAVMYDDASQDTITLGGASGTTITNVADGALNATSSDAVNGAQLFATNQAVADIDNRVTINETDIANLQTSVTNQQTTITDYGNRITQNETDITNLDNRVTTNETDITALDARVTTNEGDIVNLDNRVTTNETDITALDVRVTTNEGDIVNLDNRVTTNETDITDLDARVTTNEGDIVDLDNRVTTNTTNIASVQTQVDNVPVRFVQDANPTVPSATPTNTAAFYSAGGGATTVTNVAAGTLDATSTDAVNGAQLYATNQQVAQNRTDIDNNTTAINNINNNIAGSTVVAVQYSDSANPTVSNGGTVSQDVTLVGIDPSQAVALHNVANATLANDAVNLGQMQAYTDERFDVLASRIDALDFDLNELNEHAAAGTATAMALAGIPQTIDADKSMFGGAVGVYRGEMGFALGASTALNDGKAVIKAGASWNTKGVGGFTAGAGFSF